MRREYVNGFVYAHAGASLPHHHISSNLGRVSLNATRGGPCQFYASDLNVRVTRVGQLSSSSPDFVVVCEQHEDFRQAETRPCLIVEILRQPTQQVDMTYRAHDSLSLQGYLLVDSEERAAELSRRTPNGWQVETVEGGVRLPCLDVALRLDEVYEGVGL